MWQQVGLASFGVIRSAAAHAGAASSGTWALLLAGLVLLGAPPVGAQRSSQEHLAQGMHYLQRGRTDLALRELEAGRDAPGGREDFKLHFQLAKLYYAEIRLEDTFAAIRRAEALATTPDQEEQAGTMLRQLQAQYSPLTIRSANQEIRELRSFQIEESPDGRGVVSLDKKKVLTALAAHLEQKPMPLPAVIYLPFGFYLIEGTPVEVKKGEAGELYLRFLGPQAAQAPVGMAPTSKALMTAGIAAGAVLTLGLLALLIGG